MKWGWKRNWYDRACSHETEVNHFMKIYGLIVTLGMYFPAKLQHRVAMSSITVFSSSTLLWALLCWFDWCKNHSISFLHFLHSLRPAQGLAGGHIHQNANRQSNDLSRTGHGPESVPSGFRPMIIICTTIITICITDHRKLWNIIETSIPRQNATNLLGSSRLTRSHHF